MVTRNTPRRGASVRRGAPARPPVRIIEDPASLDELALACNSFDGYLRSPMQQFEWLQSCARALAKGGQLRVTVLGSTQATEAVAPLVVRGSLVRRLEMLGARALGEPMEWLYADETALAALAEGLVHLRQPLFLQRVWADSPMVGILKRAYAGRGLVVVRPGVPCPWIPLDQDWREPETRLSARRRADIRRARRRAEEHGATEYHILAPRPDETEVLLRDAFAVECASWKGRAGTALPLDSLTGSFFIEYARAIARTGHLRLCFLRIGEAPAAMQIAVESGDRFWLLKIGYDERFARCSPGTLLTLETIRYAARRGLRSYEFLGKVEPWTAMWTTEHRPCVSISTYPLSALGLAAFASDVVQYARRKAAKWRQYRP